MANKVYNFGAGPAMLPEPVMEKIQQEWLNYQGMGVSFVLNDSIFPSGVNRNTLPSHWPNRRTKRDIWAA